MDEASTSSLRSIPMPSLGSRQQIAPNEQVSSSPAIIKYQVAGAEEKAEIELITPEPSHNMEKDAGLEPPSKDEIKQEPLAEPNLDPEMQIILPKTHLHEKFVILPRLANPKQYKQWQKNLIVFTVAIASFGAPLASSILFPTFKHIKREFGQKETKVNLTITLFLVAMGLAPLWWSSLAERYGKRPVYLISYAVFMGASIVCALAPTLDVLLVFRFIQGLGSSSGQSVGAGTIADIFIPTERGRAFGFFYLGPLLGPLLAPIVGGALEVGFGWRSTMWFLLIFAAGMWIFMFIVLPETSTFSEKEKSPERANTFAGKIKGWAYEVVVVQVLGPLKSLGFLLQPKLALAIAYTSLTFMSLYCFSVGLPYAYTASPYNFTSIFVGLMYLGNCIGYILGSIIGGNMSDAAVKRAVEKHSSDVEAGADQQRYPLGYPPEARINSAWAGTICIPVGLLIYGWTIQTKQHYIIPLVGTFFFGLGLMIIQSTILAFLTDSVRGKSAASVVACMNIVRFELAAAGTAYTYIAVDKIGNGWFMTIMAFVMMASTGFLVSIKIIARKEAREMPAVA